MLRNFIGYMAVILGTIGTIIASYYLKYDHIWLIILSVSLFETILGVILVEEVV